MAKKGERKSQKRLSASRKTRVERKKLTWLIKGKPGQHKRDESVALGFLLRDMVKVADNMKEAKVVLSGGHVLVNGIVRRSTKFVVGLFDVVTLPENKKSFRVVLDSKGRFEAIEVSEKEAKTKLARVTGKRAFKKGAMQLETNDGRTIVEKKTDLKPDDSILLSLPDQKILKKIKLAAGAMVYIVGGEHAGETAGIKEVIPGTMKRPKLISLKGKESEFLTTVDNVFVVGEKEPEVSLSGKK